MRDSKLGIIVGRFQPFHLGHAWLIKNAIRNFEKIIIILGSPNTKDDKNPWSLNLRKRMLEKFLKREKISKRVEKIFAIKDVPDDSKWLDLIIKRIGNKKFVVIGDNEWVNGIFEKAGHKVFRPGYFERYKYEGAKIRKLIKEKKGWESRVPEYLVKFIKK